MYTYVCMYVARYVVFDHKNIVYPIKEGRIDTTRA